MYCYGMDLSFSSAPAVYLLVCIFNSDESAEGRNTETNTLRPFCRWEVGNVRFRGEFNLYLYDKLINYRLGKTFLTEVRSILKRRRFSSKYTFNVHKTDLLHHYRILSFSSSGTTYSEPRVKFVCITVRPNRVYSIDSNKLSTRK